MSIFILLASIAATVAPPSEGTARPENWCSTGIQQLRVYEIFENNKVALHDRFRDHAKRIMRRHGFDIVAMWESRQGARTELVYLLHWPDEATMKHRWAAFMADEEWARIKRETAAVHGRMVGEIEEKLLKRTDYSPC